jgi:pimeloyl-ACP methyl ester carboxylesterase
LEAYADYARANACRSYPTSALGEWTSFWDAGDQAARARCCGTLPVLVISQDPDRPKPGWTADAIAAQPIWNALQEELKKLSPNSRRIIARNSAHHVMIDRPDVVVAGIQSIVQQIRTGVADPQIGSTVTR